MDSPQRQAKEKLTTALALLEEASELLKEEDSFALSTIMGSLVHSAKSAIAYIVHHYPGA